MDELLNKIEQEIKNFETLDLNKDNIELLGELVDIRKDLKEVDKMRTYNDYDEYGENYNEGGQYNARRRRRDSRGRYMNRTDEMMDRMSYGYEEYRDGMEEYNRRGNYRAKGKGIESLEFMLESFVNFFEDLQENTQTKEEADLIKKYAKKIKEM